MWFCLLQRKKCGSLAKLVTMVLEFDVRTLRFLRFPVPLNLVFLGCIAQPFSMGVLSVEKF